MIYLALTLLSFVPVFALAQEFVSLTGIDEIENAVKQDGVANLVNYFYVTLIGIAGVIAVFQFIKAGILYAGEAASMSKKAEAKKIMQQTVFGLILIMSPFLVFSIIDPRILSLKLITGKLLPEKIELSKEEQDRLKNQDQDTRLQACRVQLTGWNNDVVERYIPITSLGNDPNCCATLGGEIAGEGSKNPGQCDLSRVIKENRWRISGKIKAEAVLKSTNGSNISYPEVEFEVNTPGIDAGNGWNSYVMIYGFKSEAECQKIASIRTSTNEELLKVITDNGKVTGRIDAYRAAFAGPDGTVNNGGKFPDNGLVKIVKILDRFERGGSSSGGVNFERLICEKIDYRANGESGTE